MARTKFIAAASSRDDEDGMIDQPEEATPMVDSQESSSSSSHSSSSSGSGSSGVMNDNNKMIDDSDEQDEDDDHDGDDKTTNNSAKHKLDFIYDTSDDEVEPKKKKKKSHTHCCVVKGITNDDAVDISKAGNFGKMSELAFSLILLYTHTKDTTNLASVCKWTYSIFLSLRSYSLNNIRLEYLNGRCNQYKTLSSVFKLNNDNRQKNICGRMGLTNFEPIDIMQDDVSLKLPNKFTKRRNILIDLYNDFTAEEKSDMSVIKREFPFDKMNHLQWSTTFPNTIEEFKQTVSRNAGDLPNLLLECLWEHNKTSSSKEKFIIAGGFPLMCLHTSRDASDIDIFCIQNGESTENCHFALRKLLFKFGDAAKKSDVKYAIVKNNGCINILFESRGSKMIQFILRRVDTIEELMTFFDIDCCRFCFDGDRVFTTREGISSLNVKYNFVPAEHKEKGMYTSRAYKYGMRGILTLFTKDHPLDHFHSRKLKLARINTDLEENDTEESEYLYGEGTDKKDLEGMYSIFNDITLSYALVKLIRVVGVKKFLAYNWENYYGSDWDSVSYSTDDYQDVDTSTIDENCDEMIRKLTVEDQHYFCLSVRELFLRDATNYYSDYYFDSHLRGKYNFWKCYCCGFYRHSRKLSNQNDGHDMCDSCSLFNSNMRSLKRDLNGKVAIVTGARIKIGFETAKALLQNGATVIATTRFSHDAYEKYQECEDFDSWKSRLFIYPLNLKDGDSILSFCAYVKNNFSKIDILINNAAQTVRRPLKYYSKLLEKEKSNLSINHLGDTIKTNNSTELVLKNEMKKVVVYSDELSMKNHCLEITEHYSLTKEDFDSNLDGMFPEGETDQFGEQKDNRKHHSWTYLLPEIDAVELLETTMINNIAPTIIVAQLMDSMKPKAVDKDDDDDMKLSSISAEDVLTGKHSSYIINVVSHEGIFNIDGKTDGHVHTNMSKAALNMLTRSASSYYAKNGILMNSCDTGWISSAIKTFMKPPLQVRDGAYRILHPILTSSLEYGKLFKNYHEAKW